MSRAGGVSPADGTSRSQSQAAPPLGVLAICPSGVDEPPFQVCGRRAYATASGMAVRLMSSRVSTMTSTSASGKK